MKFEGCGSGRVGKRKRTGTNRDIIFQAGWKLAIAVISRRYKGPNLLVFKIRAPVKS